MLMALVLGLNWEQSACTGCQHVTTALIPQITAFREHLPHCMAASWSWGCPGALCVFLQHRDGVDAGG